jgi:hypothetical protein
MNSQEKNNCTVTSVEHKTIVLSSRRTCTVTISRKHTALSSAEKVSTKLTTSHNQIDFSAFNFSKASPTLEKPIQNIHRHLLSMFEMLMNAFSAVESAAHHHDQILSALKYNLTLRKIKINYKLISKIFNKIIFINKRITHIYNDNYQKLINHKIDNFTENFVHITNINNRVLDSFRAIIYLFWMHKKWRTSTKFQLATRFS